MAYTPAGFFCWLSSLTGPCLHKGPCPSWPLFAVGTCMEPLSCSLQQVHLRTRCLPASTRSGRPWASSNMYCGWSVWRQGDAFAIHNCRWVCFGIKPEGLSTAVTYTLSVPTRSPGYFQIPNHCERINWSIHSRLLWGAFVRPRCNKNSTAILKWKKIAETPPQARWASICTKPLIWSALCNLLFDQQL